MKMAWRSEWCSSLLALPIAYVNRKYYQVGFKTLFHLSPNMDSLIAIGSTAAFAYGIFAIMRIGYGLGTGDMALAHQYHMDLYFESAAMILALITLGKYLEAKSKGKTSEAIEKLIGLAPKTATVVRGGEEHTVPVEQVQAGDIIAVKPGQSIPVDGVVVEGTTSVDEAAITGESIPVEKSPGSTVLSASINTTGFVPFPRHKGRPGYHAFPNYPPGRRGKRQQSAHCQAGRQDSRGVRACGDRHCAGCNSHLAGRGADGRVCPFHRHCRAGGVMPLRTGPCHAGGYHGGHRQRG